MNSWEQLGFLIGRWSSPVSGQPGEGVSGSGTFGYDLDGKIIIRRSRAEFAPAPGETQGQVHIDLLVIYQQPGEPSPRAIYFDNEGHVIQYSVRFPSARPGVIFESAADERGPQARLVYEQTDDRTVSVEFFVAPPGGTLESHVKGTLVRET